MPDDYEVLKLHSEGELLDALGVSNLAGADVPDCSKGVLLIRFKKSGKVTGADISRVLLDKWTGDLPVVVASESGFTSDALESASEYEDAHLFAPSA